MQVVHIAFTYLRLTLIYFHLECKILVKIPDLVLDSALALRGKEGDIGREKLYANSKIKFSSRETKNATKYLQSLLAFSYVFFF